MMDEVITNNVEMEEEIDEASIIDEVSEEIATTVEV